MSTNDRNALNLPGQQIKGTKPDATNRVRLAALRGYLRGLSNLNFSDNGRTNICKRFGLNESELSVEVAALQASRDRTTAALARTTGASVNDSASQRVKEGTAQC